MEPFGWLYYKKKKNRSARVDVCERDRREIRERKGKLYVQFLKFCLFIQVPLAKEQLEN